VRTVTDFLTQSGHARVLPIVLGDALSGAVTDEDGTWPCQPVRDLLESLGDSNLEKHLAIAKLKQLGSRAAVSMTVENRNDPLLTSTNKQPTAFALDGRVPEHSSTSCTGPTATTPAARIDPRKGRRTRDHAPAAVSDPFSSPGTPGSKPPAATASPATPIDRLAHDEL